MNELRSRIFGGRRRDPQLLGEKQPRGAKAEAGLQSVTVPRAESRTSDSRDDDRHRLAAEQVTLTHGGRTYEAVLVNVSGGGAMVEGAGFAPRLWDRVQLDLAEGGLIDCVVRWIKKDRVGLEFSPETRVDCSPGELRSLLQAVIARSFPELDVQIEPAVDEKSPPPAEERSVDEHRHDKRLPLIWRGSIHYDFASTPVRFRNISSGGALIECNFPLPIGAEPLVHIGDSGSLFAIVTWRRDNQIGLKFKEPFDLSLLSRSPPDVAPVWNPQFARPDEEETQLSPAELRERLEGFLKR